MVGCVGVGAQNLVNTVYGSWPGGILARHHPHAVIHHCTVTVRQPPVVILVERAAPPPVPRRPMVAEAPRSRCRPIGRAPRAVAPNWTRVPPHVIAVLPLRQLIDDIKLTEPRLALRL